jgi:hypothetical protein
MAAPGVQPKDLALDIHPFPTRGLELALLALGIDGDGIGFLVPRIFVVTHVLPP